MPLSVLRRDRGKERKGKEAGTNAPTSFPVLNLEEKKNEIKIKLRGVRSASYDALRNPTPTDRI